jgi:hypothetical protein
MTQISPLTSQVSSTFLDSTSSGGYATGGSGMLDVAMILAELSQKSEDTLINKANSVGENPNQKQLAEIQVAGKMMETMGTLQTSVIDAMATPMESAARGVKGG